MTEKEVLLLKRIAKFLGQSETWVKTRTYVELMTRMMDKVDNDCINIDDMFEYMENIKERK